MSEQKTTQQPEQELSEQRRVRREKLAALQAAGEDPFQETRFDWDATSAQIKEHFDQMEGRAVKVAGRLMSKRGMGKVSFCDLQDRDGRIQLYARQDEMDEAVYKKFKKFDIGDIVGVEGEVFRTQRGEMSVRAKNITLLSKALLPLPEKFHGLTDLELRYRQRYVDLIVNPEVKRNFVIRSKFIKHVRDFLDGRGYMEVETPVLNTISGGATARPFITHHNTLDIDMYLRIATELPLKRLIVGGMDRVYEIGRIFRNEGMDPKHNPEFTTVELYQAYTDFNGMMDLFEELLSTEKLPGAGISFTILLLPVILILCNTLVSQTALSGMLFGQIITFLGNPVIALFISLCLGAFVLAGKMDKKSVINMMNDACKDAGPIVLITAAGGALGAVIKATDAAGLMADGIVAAGIPAILVPLIIGVIMLRLIFVALPLVGMDQNLQYAIKGGIILFACALDMRKYLVKK